MVDEQQPIAAPEAGTISDIPPSQALGAPQHIDVISPEGEYGSVPQDQLEEALAGGYKQATPEQVHGQAQQDKYGTAGQMIKTGLEGAASGLVGSTLANAAERAIGVNPEDIRGREEANPLTHGVAETGSFIGSAILGTGEAAVLGKLGEAAAGAAGITDAVKGGSFIAKVGADAGKAAFEGALYGLDQEGGKLFKEDPEQSAGHAIANIGLSSVMTGVFGGALGAALRKTGLHPEIAEGLGESEPAQFVSGADKAAFEAGDVKTHVELNQDLTPAKKAGLTDALKLNKQKPNAKEIRAAQELLNAPETPGMTLESPVIQMFVDTTAHSPHTISGGRIRGALDEAYTHADSALQGATASANGMSKDELGQALQKSLTDDTRAAYAPVKEGYEAVAELHPHAPVTPEDIGAFRAGMKDIKEVALGATTDEGKLARQVVKALENAKNADDLSTIRNMAALKKSGVGSDPLGHIKGILRDRLEGLQEEVVSKYASSFPRNDEAGALMHATIEQNLANKAAYKPYIKKVGELASWLGKGKIHGTEDALNFMNERLSASDVAQKLFSASKDPAFLRFFGKEFPEQFKLVRDYQRMALQDSAKLGDEFSAKRFFNKFNKLEPELQKALYAPEELKKIGAAETYIRDAFPKNYNPSGTAHIAALRGDITSPKHMLIANARDYAMEKIIKAAQGSPRAAQAVELAKATAAGDKLATRAIKSVFSGVKDSMPAAVIPLSAHRAKLDKLVATYQADPSKMLAQNDSNPVPEYAQAFSATTGRAVQYLGTLKPDTTPKNPLDSKLPPNPMQKAAYDRALDIAQQPLNVLHRIAQGTLTPQDMTTLRTIYPSIYQNLSNKIMQHVVDSVDSGKPVPYKTRLQLGMFLGQPLDSTMTQPAIQAMQSGSQANKQAAQQSAQQPQGRAPSASSVKGLSKLSTQAQTQGQARQADKSDGKL